MMSMGVIFAMRIVFLGVSKWLQNGGCIPSEWYRNSFGIVFRQNGACFSKLASTKLQHEKADSKFFAKLLRFEMLKSAHSPSVYWGKIIFQYRESVQIFYFLPLTLTFTLVNSELKNFSSDKMTFKWLIIKHSWCHLSLVTFAFTLSLLQFSRAILTPLGRVIKIHVFYARYLKDLSRIFMR